MAAVVEISNLSFAYADSPVLQSINLKVDRGTVLGLIGPNGGGKTTLIKLLIGLLQPTSGQLQIAGLSPRQAVHKGDVLGYLPQNPPPPDRFPLNVRQVIHLGLSGKAGLLHRPAKADRNFADFLLERVGLADKATTPVGQLSGGQLQRVLIARALAPRPSILLLDEPTTGIDRAGQENFIEFLLGLKQELNLTVIVVSHDLRAVSALSDRIACLNVTLHCHDVPQRLPADVIYGLFACDLQAMGIGGETRNQKPEIRKNPQLAQSE